MTAEELSSSKEGEFTYLISISTFCYDFGDVFGMNHRKYCLMIYLVQMISYQVSGGIKIFFDVSVDCAYCNIHIVLNVPM